MKIIHERCAQDHRGWCDSHFNSNMSIFPLSGLSEQPNVSCPDVTPTAFSTAVPSGYFAEIPKSKTLEMLPPNSPPPRAGKKPYSPSDKSSFGVTL